MSKAPQILLVEENRSTALLIECEIAKEYGGSRVLTVSSEQDALEELAGGSFDMAFVDLDLAGFDGPGFIKRVRERDIDVPVIAMVSGRAESLVTDADKSGIPNCVIKDDSLHLEVPHLVGQVLYHQALKGEFSKLRTRNRQDEHAAMMKIAAGTLSHEINNPLMAILGTSELILDNGGRYDRDVVKKVRIIQRSARRIETTLRRLAAISEPAMRQTASGALIDPGRSRVFSRTRT